MVEPNTSVHDRERVESTEDAIDIRRYVRAVWRRRYRILLTTLASGVVTWVFTAQMVHNYESVAQIEMGPSQSTAKVQRVLTDPAFAAEVIAQHGLAGAPEFLTYSTFNSLVRVTPGATPETRRIHAGFQDPAVAIAVARDVAQRIPGRVRALEAEAAKVEMEAARAELKKSEQNLVDAQEAIVALTLQHPGIARAAALARSQTLYDELGSIRAQIVGIRARIGSASAQLERLRSHGPEAEPLRQAVRQARAVAEIELEGLQAGEEYLTASIGGPPDGQLAIPMDVKMTHELLQADAARAYRSREAAREALIAAPPAESPFPRVVEGQVIKAIQVSPNLFKNLSSVMMLVFLASLVASAVPVPSAGKDARA